MVRSAAEQGRGIVQVYTGDGKGKTTAAWGQALRAVGHGYRVAVVRFLKPTDSGEVKAAARLSPELAVFGHTSPYDPNVDQRSSRKLRSDSRRNFDEACGLIRSGEYDLVVLDEMNVVLHYRFVSVQELLKALDERPPHVEVILTGRYAPGSLIDAADLVTEMTEVKHPLEAGLGARRGIEY